ncbi:hypothetical protein ACN47E_001187 [Coniothyrium glycines]
MVNELPPHPELEGPHIRHAVTLPQFLDNLLTEVEQVDFDNGFIDHGKWHPEGIHIDMPEPDVPAKNATQAGNSDKRSTRPVTISVHQRVRSEGKRAWCARTSYHHENEVTYDELDYRISRDHSIKEALYTPSVYDANLLLSYSSEVLDEVIKEIGAKHGLQELEMSIFEMFHKMPKVAGLGFLQDRVFHVLVVTAHSTSRSNNESEASPSVSDVPQSFTAQLPIDFESLSQLETISKRSHAVRKGSSTRYQYPEGSPGAKPATDVQRKSKGNKLTEGNYVSVERLRKARETSPNGDTVPVGNLPESLDCRHRWDMMTLSDAGGITRIAPGNTAQNETLDAIAADVEYVLKHVAQTRSLKNGSQPSRTTE